jgi:hypothetical protein
MKTSTVLKHAKRYLATTYKNSYDYVNQEGQEKFICIAIMTAASHNKRISDKDVERCRKMIASRLEGNDSLEGWLMHKGCIHEEFLLFDRATKDRIQQHRHAWLDMLITEFKSKGD